MANGKIKKEKGDKSHKLDETVFNSRKEVKEFIDPNDGSSLIVRIENIEKVLGIKVKKK